MDLVQLGRGMVVGIAREADPCFRAIRVIDERPRADKVRADPLDDPTLAVGELKSEATVRSVQVENELITLELDPGMIFDHGGATDAVHHVLGGQGRAVGKQHIVPYTATQECGIDLLERTVQEQGLDLGGAVLSAIWRLEELLAHKHGLGILGGPGVQLLDTAQQAHTKDFQIAH